MAILNWTMQFWATIIFACSWYIIYAPSILVMKYDYSMLSSGVIYGGWYFDYDYIMFGSQACSSFKS